MSKGFKRENSYSNHSTLFTGDFWLDRAILSSIVAASGKSQSDIASDLGISHSAVSQYMRLKAPSGPFYRYMERLARNEGIEPPRRAAIVPA